MPRSSRDKSTQPVQGEVFGIFKITGESPKRNTRGSLAWDCECVAANHPIQIEHAVLAYGSQPSQCTTCAQQAASQRLNEKIEERKLSRELAITLLEQHRNERLAQQAQIAQQQEGIEEHAQ